MVQYLFLTFLLLMGVLVIYSCIYLAREAGKLHVAIDDFFRRARNAGDYATLKLVNEEAHAYAQKYCWHRHHATRFRELFAFIQGRVRHL
jgi:hypothetical protein